MILAAPHASTRHETNNASDGKISFRYGVTVNETSSLVRMGQLLVLNSVVSAGVEVDLDPGWRIPRSKSIMIKTSLPAQSFLAHLGTSILDDGTFHCLRPLIHTQGNSPYSLRIHDVCTLLFCRGGVGGHRRLHGIKWRVNLKTVKRA